LDERPLAEAESRPSVVNTEVRLTQTRVEEPGLPDTVVVVLVLVVVVLLPALLLQTACACCIGIAKTAVSSATPPSTIREIPFFALIVLLIIFILYLLLALSGVLIASQLIRAAEMGEPYGRIHPCGVIALTIMHVDFFVYIGGMFSFKEYVLKPGGRK